MAKKKPAAKQPKVKPQPNSVIYQPATVEACQADYREAKAKRDGNSNRRFW